MAPVGLSCPVGCPLPADPSPLPPAASLLPRSERIRKTRVRRYQRSIFITSFVRRWQCHSWSGNFYGRETDEEGLHAGWQKKRMVCFGLLFHC